MIELDASSVLLQWATGGLLFLWVTTRHRVVGLGYGWLMRGVYAVMAAGALWIGVTLIDPVPVRDISSAGVAISATVALVVSIARRRAGVEGQRLESDRRTERVAEMTGIGRAEQTFDDDAAEFPPVLDLIPALIGAVGLVAAGASAGDPVWLSVSRMLVGAAFLGAITDAMLLGHWYLVQPGLARTPLLELVRWVMIIWPFEIVLLLVPTGMVSALNGTIDDGYNGLLGWFWLACAVTTIGLALVTRAALRERSYSAVMAATGLLYLAILTAFGTDLVARALLA
jgi:hypothetical protein